MATKLAQLKILPTGNLHKLAKSRNLHRMNENCIISTCENYPIQLHPCENTDFDRNIFLKQWNIIVIDTASRRDQSGLRTMGRVTAKKVVSGTVQQLFEDSDEAFENKV